MLRSLRLDAVWIFIGAHLRLLFLILFEFQGAHMNHNNDFGAFIRKHGFSLK